MYECQVNTEPKINYKVFLSVQDPNDALQKDSPYYHVTEDNRDNNIVMKHHISQIEKEGFSMFLHDNGCICPKPEIVTQRNKQDRTHMSKHSSGQELTISGGPIKYLSTGDEMTLECQVSGPCSSLQWSHQDKIMTPRTRAGMSLETLYKPEVSRTVLFMSQVDLSDTGNYTCRSDTRSQTVLVVVTGPQ